jgi:cell division protein FtsZ
MIQFDLPQKQSSIIKVIGVGGGGGNAVNYMYNLGIDGVDFVLANTDVKALEASPIPLKVQIGPALTQGLGAGANPDIGQKACEESIAEITNILKENTKMVFVTAGMGGGTGTGGAPIVARVAKELGILTVGIVTTPFSHEGNRRKKQAEIGIDKMKESVDTILVISNDKLRHQFGNLGFREAFSKADDILATATKCITDVINSRGHVIVDFADVCTVMRDGGTAILGSAEASGENRAQEAVEKAINSPLLNDNDIAGAKWVLLNINSSEGEFEHTIDEMDVIQNYVQTMAGDNCDVILGVGYDNSLEEKIGVTIIATGFSHKELEASFDAKQEKPEDKKIIQVLSKAEDTNTTMPNTDVAENNVAVVSNATTLSNALPQELMPSLVVPQVQEPAIPKALSMGMRPSAQMPASIIQEPVVEMQIVQKEIEQEFVAPQQSESKVIFDLSVEPTSNNIANEKPIAQNEAVNTNNNNAETITLDGITIPRKIGSRYLTDDEIREKVNFELQKKAFEDRVNRLRTTSFDIQTPGSNDHVESIPAYLRNNKPFEEETPSASGQLSDYSVPNNGGEIDRRNKWLHNNSTTD